MGYRIEYRSIKRVRGMERRTVRVPAFAAVCFLLFLVLVNSAWPQGAQIIQEIFFPEDTMVSNVSFDALLNQLREGQGVVNVWNNALQGYGKGSGS